MDSDRSMTRVRRHGPHASVVRRRALETSYWALAAVLLVVYCGAQTYSDREQRQAFSIFFKSREGVRIENDAALESGALTNRP
jgi:hypothetical protein